MNDLLVAGAGPAGLATAIHAARAGLDVTVVERRSGPIDKACGEGLMPHTLRHLDGLGITPHGKPFRGITYLDRTRRVEARFPGPAGRGVRRTVLSEALHDAAATAGVRIVKGDIGDIEQDANSVRCAGLEARYLAAADGLHSPIRRQLGLDRPVKGDRRWGIRRHFQTAPWSDTVEVYWAAHTEAYVTPVSDDCVGVAILTSRQGKFDDHLREFPWLAEQLAGAEGGSARAAGPLRQRAASQHRGRVMLVGDAAGYVDALTGEGLGIALGGAELVVGAILADDPADYTRQWRRMSRRYRLLTAALLTASQSPARTMIVPAAATLPKVFNQAVKLLAQ
jgi:flavin-dependent dehydrogenase